MVRGVAGSWRAGHAESIDRTDGEVTKEYVQTLLGPEPPDPATTPIPPTNLTPLQLAASGWFPQPDDAGHVSDIAHRAALTEGQRKEILQLAEARGETSPTAWLHQFRLVRLAAYFPTSPAQHALHSGAEAQAACVTTP